MPRYIDVDELLRKTPDIHDYYDESGERDSSQGYTIAAIEAAPTLSPDDVRGVGEWSEDAMRIKCSACGTDFNDEVTCCSDCYRWPWNYCPNCGARMMEVTSDA
jgi:hypothetical protein